MKTVIFDIETGPLPPKELATLLPPFDPATIKTGNLGPEKAAEKVQAAEMAHAEHYKARAALSSLTGRVLTVGYKRDSRFLIPEGATERDLLLRFWEQYTKIEKQGGRMVGHNIFGFDLPFLHRRSWILGLADKIPSTVIKQDRYWSPVFIDTMIRWRLGDHREYVSLDTLAKAFGIGGKTDGVTGADFARLWAEERPRAVAYLRNDLEMTFQVALRMGIA